MGGQSPRLAGSEAAVDHESAAPAAPEAAPWITKAPRGAAGPDGQPADADVKSDTPWLEDEVIARKLIAEFEEPINFMFYLANRSGLRSGEPPA
jgi:hypothetical protein